MANELLPCPFCGAAASISKIDRDWWRIAADHDDNCALDTDHRLDAPQTPAGREWIVTAWNARATPAQQDAPTDADIQTVWDEACKDTPQAPGWNRHIRFARALLVRFAPAQDAEQARDAERLDWMSERRAYIAWSRDRNSCHVMVSDDDGRFYPAEGWGAGNYDTAREAIDAARAPRAEGEQQ